MELYISDHPLDCLTCPANGDCELQDMAGVDRPARSALRLRRREPPEGQEGRVEPVLHLRPVQVHRLQPLRARLRGNAGHLRADDRRARLRIARLGRARTSRSWNRNACPAAPASPPARPRRCRKRPSSGSASPSTAVITTCAYCGVGCSLQGRDEGQRGRAHGAVQERQGQRRPRLREGPLRLGLRDAQGPHHQADDPREDHRPVARSVSWDEAIDYAASRIPPHPGQVRPRFDRRHHVVALHERRNLPRAEAGARRVRQQQRRHLRARLPLADRLRPEDRRSANRPARRPSSRSRSPT